jgi:hypothetical protein
MSKKPKKKLTSAQRKARKRRKQEFMTVFMNGKQVRVRRPSTIDGMAIDEFIQRNADPIWLHQQGEYADLHERENQEQAVDGEQAHDSVCSPLRDL